MRVVTRLTGLSPDAIRKWQVRYGAVEPSRTPGGTRKFSAEDVRRLTLLGQLAGRGHRIGDVARLPTERLEALVAGAPGTAEAAAATVGEEDVFTRLRREYLQAARRFEVRRAAEVLSRGALLAAPTDLTWRVVLPVLREVGELWSHGELSVAHEHLVSAQVRGLLTNLLHWRAPQSGARRVIVTTPEGHLHEFGALVGAFVCAGRGFEPVYLGPSLPEADIRLAVDQSRAELLLLSVVRDVPPAERAALAAQLRRLAERVETWVGLPEQHGLVGLQTGARLFHRYEDLDMALTQLGVAGHF